MRLKIKYSTRKRIQTKYFLMPTLGILKCVMTAEAEDADKKKDGKEACKCMILTMTMEEWYSKSSKKFEPKYE